MGHGVSHGAAPPWFEQTQRKLVFCLSEEEGGALFKLPLGRGVAGLCAATNRAVNIVDCANDARFDGSTDKASGFTTRTLLAVPIEACDRGTGLPVAGQAPHHACIIICILLGREALGRSCLYYAACTTLHVLRCMYYAACALHVRCIAGRCSACYSSSTSGRAAHSMQMTRSCSPP